MTKRERGGDVDENARDALPHRADRARVQGAGPPVAGDGVVEALGAVDERYFVDVRYFVRRDGGAV